MEELTKLVQSIYEYHTVVAVTVVPLATFLVAVLKQLVGVRRAIEDGLREMEDTVGEKIDNLAGRLNVLQNNLDDSKLDRREIHEKLGRLDQRIFVLEQKIV